MRLKARRRNQTSKIDSGELQLSALESAASRGVPEWLTLEKEAFRGTINAFPTRDQMPQSYNEQLVVELYSK